MECRFCQCAGRVHRPQRPALFTTRAGAPQVDLLSTCRDRTSERFGDVLSDIVSSRPSVAFRSDLWSTSDSEVLRKSMNSWRSRSSELCPYFQETIMGASQLQPHSFEVKWRARWVPPQLLWLDSLGRAWPGVSVEYYDVLDRCD